MKCSFFLFVLLAGCSTAGPAAESSPTVDGLTVDELSRIDVRGTASSIEIIARDVENLSPEMKSQAAESLRILSVNCPYTRSAVQLPFALHKVVMDIDPERLDRFVQRDWETLQEGLTTHVAVLDALEVELPEPARGDHLYGRDPGLMIDRDTLLAAEDPIRVTSRLISEITVLAEQVDEPTLKIINLHSDLLEEATGVGRPCPRGPWATLPGQPWTLGMQLGGWHDALRRVEPFVEDPEVRVQIEAMIEVLDAYAEAGLA